ncbi:MAG: bifunctional phosphoribosylaminoimidazolecarboxamide formyltransferase/IMP cyclohydrolase, partial [candidate division Zixibacteria bacterium]|nr:bifunctional phosphoribosylaminoimidazolecarboxamide formyltransferase/IMP cyclohydrolase [candidate division Zixibacteria bacterium]
MSNAGEAKIKRALLSVSDKSGIVELARFLEERGVEIISTGGTKQVLKEAGVRVVPVSSFTGAPEILDGRVKTLHPKIAAGILYCRDSEEHQQQMDTHDYKRIDLVVVNLYPFEKTVARGAADDEVIENIDIGGPTLVRAAAKNYTDVTVLVEPTQYEQFKKEFAETEGALSMESRRHYAARAFALVAGYDRAIDNYFAREESKADESELPDSINISLAKSADLRYGENPHQQAALYRDQECRSISLVDAEQLSGKALSYNNYS